MKKVKALVAFLSTQKGQHQIHMCFTALLALYVALHQAGLL